MQIAAEVAVLQEKFCWLNQHWNLLAPVVIAMSIKCRRAVDAIAAMQN